MAENASPSPEQMAAVFTEVLSNWRIQENLFIGVYTLYIYYFLTTLHEEVAVFWKQSLRMGKILFFVLRYVTLAMIISYLIRDFRWYLSIGPKSCKLLLVVGEDSFKGITLVLSDVTFGICLCALLGARLLYTILIILVCAVLPAPTFVLHLIGDIQLPAQDTLTKELGYPCYLNSNEAFLSTPAGLGRNTRAYVNFARTILLMLLAVATMVIRYRKNHGRLIYVICRDGGLYYLTVAATRLVAAVVTTPTVVPFEELSQNPSVVIVGALQEVVVPLLAQRLLLNIRSVDCMGSTPLASTLLFSPAEDKPGSPSSQGGSTEAYNMPQSFRRTSMSGMGEGRAKEEATARRLCLARMGRPQHRSSCKRT